MSQKVILKAFAGGQRARSIKVTKRCFSRLLSTRNNPEDGIQLSPPTSRTSVIIGGVARPLSKHLPFLTRNDRARSSSILEEEGQPWAELPASLSLPRLRRDYL